MIFPLNVLRGKRFACHIQSPIKEWGMGQLKCNLANYPQAVRVFFRQNVGFLNSWILYRERPIMKGLSRALALSLPF